MDKKIQFSHTVYELTTAHPEIISILQEQGFDQITKPGMLQTAGRMMTIPNGCRMKGISVDTVKEALRNHGFTIVE
ncbi:DUF1858 domain-containing protein [Alkalihalobacillus sp. BA299]|uniref:DUF1858 domain-containing protein n=1 Tax=Alkalihalobacillus sp. BA299 TaxID=2815938 RepID=UPI001ADC1D27|nr:DUF1858 domain-containing protein [Alkalihalobacillus sp. BA299]